MRRSLSFFVAPLILVPVLHAGLRAQGAPDIRLHPNAVVQQYEMSLAIHPSSARIILVAGIATDTNGHQSSIGRYYSTDAGVNWRGGDTLPTHTNPSQVMADPSAAINLNGCLFVSNFYGYPGGDFALSTSTNGGGTWTLTDVPSSDVQVDKPHIVVDLNARTPYLGRIYAAYTGYNAAPPDPIKFIRSTDGGATFSSPIVISGAVAGTSFASGVNLAVGGNGVLYAAWVGLKPGGSTCAGPIPLGFNTSEDGGTSWGTARCIDTINTMGTLVKGGIAITAWGYPSMAVDRSPGPRQGWIYIVYSERNPTTPDVILIRSTDGGLSWGGRVRVNQDNGVNDQWQSWMTVDPSTGHLYVVYYDSRNFPANDSVQVFVARSTDGGATFQDLLVSDVPFLPKPVRHNGPPNYIGSYIGIAALHDTVWVCWNDNRTDFHQAYASRIVFPPVEVESSSSEVPESFALDQNYPNPFNPSTTIKYELPEASHVRLSVYDLLGRQVCVLVNERRNAGVHEVKVYGSNLSSGVYLYKLQAGNFVQSRKLLVVR